MGVAGWSVFTAFKAKDGITPAFKNMVRGSNQLQGRFLGLNRTTKEFGSCIRGTCNRINSLTAATIAFFTVGKLKQGFDHITEAASNMQETQGKVEQVFGTSSKAIDDWAKTSIRTMGLSKQSAKDIAALYGDMAVGMKIPQKEAVVLATNLTRLGADLASFKNISNDEAKTALKSVFTGETESLKNLGIVMTQANLQEYAYTIGLKKKIAKMKETEKVMLRYKYVLDRTKTAQKDFERTGENFANQKRMNAEVIKEMNTIIGNSFLPYYTRMYKNLNKTIADSLPNIEKYAQDAAGVISSAFEQMSPVFERFKDSIKYLQEHLLPELVSYGPIVKFLFEDVFVPGLNLAANGVFYLIKAFDKTYNFIKDYWIPIVSAISGIGGMLAVKKAFDMTSAAITWYNTSLMISSAKGIEALKGFGKIKFIMGSYTRAVWKSVAAIWAQTAALLMNPWTWVAVGIGLVVAGVILLWKNWDKVTETMSVWKTNAKKFLSEFWEKCKQVFGSIGDYINNHFINAVLNCLGPLRWIIDSVKYIRDLSGKVNQYDSAAGYKNIYNSPPYKQGYESKTNGRIDVGISVDNNTPYPVSSSVGLLNPGNLNLVPKLQ